MKVLKPFLQSNTVFMEVGSGDCQLAFAVASSSSKGLCDRRFPLHNGRGSPAVERGSDHFRWSERAGSAEHNKSCIQQPSLRTPTSRGCLRATSGYSCGSRPRGEFICALRRTGSLGRMTSQDILALFQKDSICMSTQITKFSGYSEKPDSHT